MRENFKSSLAQVLKYEGGYSNHPRDPGGATMKGVTQRVYDAWRRKHSLAPRSVRYLEQSELEAIYKHDYWDKVHGDDLPSGVDLAVFDLAVNSGVSRAAKMLQACVGVAQDGIIGPATLAAVRHNPRCHISLCDHRLAFLQRLGTWSTFGRGWGARVADVKKKCCKLADSPPVEHAPPTDAAHPDHWEEATYTETPAYPEHWDEFAHVPDEIPTYAPPTYDPPPHAEEHHPHRKPPANLKGGLIAAATATAGALQQSDFVSISDNGWTGLAMVAASIAFAVWQAVIPAINGEMTDDVG
jgi:hypothetical protein